MSNVIVFLLGMLAGLFFTVAVYNIGEARRKKASRKKQVSNMSGEIARFIVYSAINKALEERRKEGKEDGK